MSNITLPTTIGSIVTFSMPDDETRLVATLLAGSIENGIAYKIVWSDAFNEGLDTNEFTKEEILAGDPEIVFIATPNADLTPLEEEVEANYGEVVLYNQSADVAFGEQERLLAIYAPGYVDPTTGEFAEACWVNSYGTYASMEDVLNGNPQVISKGWDEQN